MTTGVPALGVVVVFVVGTFWVGWAARIGHEQNVFWILAIVTFYLPLAAAVIFLVRLMPLEGGLYQWSKLAFNDFVAFMVGWNLWVFAISILAEVIRTRYARDEEKDGDA